MLHLCNYAGNAIQVNTIIVLICGIIVSVLNFFLYFQYIITIIFALVVGAVYWQLDTDQNGYQNRLILYCVSGCIISVAFYCLVWFVAQGRSYFLHRSESGVWKPFCCGFVRPTKSIIHVSL